MNTTLYDLIVTQAKPAEYEAARRIAFLLDSDLLKPADLWRVLRPCIVRQVRGITEQLRIDSYGPTEEPETLREMAAEFEADARCLEREDARQSFDRCKKLYGTHPDAAVRLQAYRLMRSEWRLFHGL